MGETIQESCGQRWITKNLGPVRKSQVSRDNDRSSFVSLCKNLEQQLSSLPGEGNIAQFIYNEQTILAVALNNPAQLFLIAGFDQFIGQC